VTRKVVGVFVRFRAPPAGGEYRFDFYGYGKGIDLGAERSDYCFARFRWRLEVKAMYSMKWPAMTPANVRSALQV
jgi:hypothetical protein